MKFKGENKPESNILKQLELLRDRCQDHDKIALSGWRWRDALVVGVVSV